MEIKRAGSQSSNKGPADWFTGTVRIDPLFEAREYFVAGDRRIDREALGKRRVIGRSRVNPLMFVAQASRSSRVPAPPGTRIRWGKR